jgi:hypothetical protein
MRQVSYTGGTFLTGDAIAALLVDYAAELANSERAAAVWVPTPDGADVELLLGPASELLTTPADDQRPDPDPAPFEERVRGLILELRRGVAR